MRITFRISRVLLLLGCMFLFTGVLSAGEKKLMHCFYFTSIPEATQADWQAFFKATDELPSKIPGLERVWYGKLARPLRAGDLVRDWGVCMEMADEAALKAYGAAPAHDEWTKVYFKVRKPGTTTINFIGQ
jgi:hypothetical protein